jgi:uncharacterized protein Veg
MKKIILLTEGSLTDNDYYILNDNKFYKKKNVKIEIWNFNFFFDNKFNKKSFLFEIKLKNFNHFDSLILKNKNFNCLYDVRVNFRLKSLIIFYFLSKYNCKFILHIGFLENEVLKNNKFNFFNKIRSIFSHKLFLFICSRIEFLFFYLNLHKIFKIKFADYIYVIGKETFYNLNKITLFGPYTRVIRGHHRNYDLYLLLKKKNRLRTKNKKFFLFIDQGVPVHPDLIKLKFNDIKLKEYYQSVSNFILKVEKELNIKAKIAAHPKIDTKILLCFFKKSQIEKYKTLELIYNSIFIITHNSTVINFAAFLKKPIIFCINNSLIRSEYNHLHDTVQVANKFKKNVVNIDNFNIKELNNEFAVDNNYYKKYTENYFKFGKSNIMYSRQLVNILNSKN